MLAARLVSIWGARARSELSPSRYLSVLFDLGWKPDIERGMHDAHTSRQVYAVFCRVPTVSAYAVQSLLIILCQANT